MIGLHPTSVNESYEKELEIVAANLELPAGSLLWVRLESILLG
mgnify:CR=1 FL=1